MTRSSTWAIAMVVAATAFATARVYSQDNTPRPEELAAMWSEIAKPVEQNKALAETTGVWDAEVTVWWGRDETAKTKGVATVRALNNGLVVVEEFNCDLDEKSFRSLGLYGRFQSFSMCGYSKERNEYFGAWSDSATTTPEMQWGTADASGKVVTFEGAETVGSFGAWTTRWVRRSIDADHRTLEHWQKLSGETKFRKDSEVRYARRK